MSVKGVRPNAERDKEILRDWLELRVFARVAEKYGLSLQRVRDIVDAESRRLTTPNRRIWPERLREWADRVSS